MSPARTSYAGLGQDMAIFVKARHRYLGSGGTAAMALSPTKQVQSCTGSGLVLGSGSPNDSTQTPIIRPVYPIPSCRYYPMAAHSPESPRSNPVPTGLLLGWSPPSLRSSALLPPRNLEANLPPFPFYRCGGASTDSRLATGLLHCCGDCGCGVCSANITNANHLIVRKKEGATCPAGRSWLFLWECAM